MSCTGAIMLSDSTSSIPLIPPCTSFTPSPSSYRRRYGVICAASLPSFNAQSRGSSTQPGRCVSSLSLSSRSTYQASGFMHSIVQEKADQSFLTSLECRIRRRNSLCFLLTHSLSSCNGSLLRSHMKRRLLSTSQRPSKTCFSRFPHRLYHQPSHRPLPLRRRHPSLADCLTTRKRCIPQTLHQTSSTSAFMSS